MSYYILTVWIFLNIKIYSIETPKTYVIRRTKIYYNMNKTLLLHEQKRDIVWIIYIWWHCSHIWCFCIWYFNIYIWYSTEEWNISRVWDSYFIRIYFPHSKIYLKFTVQRLYFSYMKIQLYQRSFLLCCMSATINFPIPNQNLIWPRCIFWLYLLILKIWIDFSSIILKNKKSWTMFSMLIL